MTRDANDVYKEVFYANSKSELISLEKKYADKKDWASALVATNALIEHARTREDFLEFGRRSDKYWENFCREHKNGGNSGNGGNNDGSKKRIGNYET